MPTSDRPLFRAIGREVETETDGDWPGHDTHHAWRGLRLGRRLAEECDAKRLIAGAALTRGIHRTMGGSEFVDPRDSLPVVDDVLAAMGAIGVGRTFRVSGARGTPMWTSGADSRACYDKTDYSRSVLDRFEREWRGEA